MATNNCNVAPETAVSYEIGTKWDFLDNALSVTGAIFRNDRTNYKVADNDPTNLSGQPLLRMRVRYSLSNRLLTFNCRFNCLFTL